MGRNRGGRAGRDDFCQNLHPPMSHSEMDMTPFIEKLQSAQVTNDSWVCVGLDPAMGRMPGDEDDGSGPDGTGLAPDHDLALPFLDDIDLFELAMHVGR